MGQKVHPFGIRLGITTTHRSVWFAKNYNFAEMLQSDKKIRDYLSYKLKHASLDFIGIERLPQYTTVIVHSGRPGVIIGKKGEGVQELNKELAALMEFPIKLKVKEIKQPDLNAQLVADASALQIEKRVSLRRIMQKVVQNAMKAGAKGVKISLSGRLNGAEIARTEWSQEGRVPTHTLRAEISYAQSTAHTTFGAIGIKVWIFIKEMLTSGKSKNENT